MEKEVATFTTARDDSYHLSLAFFQGRLSTQSNVWSFGITVWELLTLCRQRPFALLTDIGKKIKDSLCSGAAPPTLLSFAEVLQNAEHAYYNEGLQVRCIALVKNHHFDYLLFRWSWPNQSSANGTFGTCWKNAGIVTKMADHLSRKSVCF